MDHKDIGNFKNLAPPSWKQVRGIYKKLSDEFHTLTNAFGVSVDPQTKINLDHLIIVIDEVDNCIDELPTKSQRDSVTASLIAYLRNEESQWHHPDATESLATKMKNIKLIVNHQKIVNEFTKAAKDIFHYTEVKRHTTNVDDLINFITLEGAATARLPLSILQMSADSPFGLFFTRLCRLMGIADLVFDAKSDYKKGFIALKPKLGLYLRLHGIMIREGLKLLLSIPKKLQFLVYAFRFTLALMRED